MKTEFDLAAVDLSGLLSKSDADKAKQVPDPSTYHLLCILQKADDTYESGLVKADKTVQFEELLSPVLFVVKVGPDAFKDEKRFPSGPSCKEGDYIIVRPNSGTRMKIHGVEFRIINDDSVEGTVEDPRAIQRV
jgi:co-chaperonin GroES (HSP10)